MSADPVGFERDIKPLFRERDRGAMSFMFDLWAYDDVNEHADEILAAVAEGAMPCDAPWDPRRVDLMRRWIDEGKAA